MDGPERSRLLQSRIANQRRGTPAVTRSTLCILLGKHTARPVPCRNRRSATRVGSYAEGRSGYPHVAGRCVLFPSSMMHKVEPVRATSPRLSFAILLQTLANYEPHDLSSKAEVDSCR